MRWASEVADAEVARLADAQSGAVGTEEQHAVLRRAHGGEHLGDFVGARDVEERARHLGVRDAFDHLGAAERDGVEELEGGDVHLEVGGAVVEGAGEVEQIRAHVLGAELGGRAAEVGGELASAAQVLGARHFGKAA